MPPSSQNLFIAYFPYINMQNVPEIDLGFAKVWNFDQKKVAYIPDSTIRSHIENILATHVTHHGSVKGIGILSIGAIDFREPTDEEYKLMRYARLILFISFLAQNNTAKPDPNVGHFMATSENFDLVYQKTIIGSDYLSEATGEVIHFSIGGLHISQHKFQRPSFVPSSLTFRLDDGLFQGLLKLRTKKPMVFERIMNATEIFLESYYNSPYLSRSARILLQLSAFEILLNLPEEQQRKAFKEAIHKISYLPGEPIKSYFSERFGGKKVREKLSLKGYWADQFYTLRNHIIHGTTPAPREFIFNKSQRHLDIAVLYFVLSVKKQIEKSLSGFPCDYEIKWDTWDDGYSIPSKNRSGFVYELSFGRFFRRQLRNKKPKIGP